MSCPRCNVPCSTIRHDSGEHFVSCGMCGYYSARVIDCFVNEHAVYRTILHEPLGVVVTDKGNYQYFTERQLNELLISYDATAYTYKNKNHVWKYHDLMLGSSQSLNAIGRSVFYLGESVLL